MDGVSSHQKRYLTEFVQDKYHLISPGIRRLQIFPPRISLEEDDQRDPGCYLLTNKKFIENTYFVCLIEKYRQLFYFLEKGKNMIPVYFYTIKIENINSSNWAIGRLTSQISQKPLRFSFIYGTV